MRQYSSLSSQSGVALIAVLLFLILIMIVGAIAVRQASVDLNVAASDQVGTLLLNNSDSVLAHIETAAASTTDPQYATMMSQQNGVLGYFAVDGRNQVGHQLSFCYRPKDPKMFNIDNAPLLKPVKGGEDSYVNSKACNASNSTDYTSDRMTAMTQVIVRALEDKSSDNFDNATRGTSEAGSTDSAAPKIQLNSVSVLPAMSDKSASEIQGCLSRPVGDATSYGYDNNVNDCLRSNNIPSTFVVEEAMLKKEESRIDAGTEVENPCALPEGKKLEDMPEAIQECIKASSAPPDDPVDP